MRVTLWRSRGTYGAVLDPVDARPAVGGDPSAGIRRLDPGAGRIGLDDEHVRRPGVDPGQEGRGCGEPGAAHHLAPDVHRRAPSPPPGRTQQRLVGRRLVAPDGLDVPGVLPARSSRRPAPRSTRTSSFMGYGAGRCPCWSSPRGPSPWSAPPWPDSGRGATPWPTSIAWSAALIGRSKRRKSRSRLHLRPARDLVRPSPCPAEGPPWRKPTAPFRISDITGVIRIDPPSGDGSPPPSVGRTLRMPPGGGSSRSTRRARPPVSLHV